MTLANPAALLHTQLVNWRTPGGQAVRDVRVTVEGSDEAVMRQTQLAMGHLRDIDELLTGMEAANRRTGSFRRAFPRWQAWVMAYPRSWVHAMGDGIFDSDHDLDLLENLADALEQLRPDITDNERAGMSSTLDEVRAALSEDESLPEPLRRHLHGVLSHASTCLEEYDLFGDFELQKAMDRLLVSVNLASRVSTEPSRWQRIKEHFVFPMAVGLILQAPENVTRIAEIMPPL